MATNQATDMETTPEEKPVTTESPPTGGESGVCEVETNNQEPCEVDANEEPCQIVPHQPARDVNINQEPCEVDANQLVCEVDAIHEPCVGMIFQSEQAAKAFYDEYARRVGFFTRIISSRKSERDGSIVSQRLACNKEGFNQNRQRSGRVRIRKRDSIREGCKAMIMVKREMPGRWVVTKFEKEHNHLLLGSSEKGRTSLCVLMSQDDKDKRIRELLSELNDANQKLALCREQLQTVMTYIEEHTTSISKTVEEVVHKIKEVEPEKKSRDG